MYSAYIMTTSNPECFHRNHNNILILEKLDNILHIMFGLFIYNLLFYLSLTLVGLHWKITMVKIIVNIIMLMILIYKIYCLIFDIYAHSHTRV